MITVRVAESDDDLEAWRQVFMVVLPNERAVTVEEMRGSVREGLLRLLAESDGVLVGSGIAARSDFPRAASVAPRVLPEFRRRGAGTALLRVLARHVESLSDVDAVNAHVDDPVSLAFAEKYGFTEANRQVEQVRTVGVEPWPRAPDGIEIVSVAQRPSAWPDAYEVLAQQAFQDMALDRPISATLEQWNQEWISDPEAMFVAYAGGEVIGCAGLMLDGDQPDRAENALTAVRRDWRGKGVAAALKRTTLAWAADHGLREVYTWTQRGNADMRRLNEHLGYVNRAESIHMRAGLPLTV
jgi:GNAT superfamily N-acetyltransferase